MKKIILLFLLYFFSLNTLYSFDIKDLGTINSYVIDKVGVLNNEEKTQIEQKIIELKNKYTTEILTIIIKSTNGEDISSVGTQIGQDLGVGKADKDNGVVILIAIDDRSWNISTGYGVEGVLPDILTNRIGENNFVLFREKKYKDGIIGALNDFDKAFSGDTSIISTHNDKKNPDDSIIILIIIALIFSIIFLKPLHKEKQYKKLFLYLFIGYIITLPLAYFLIKTIELFLINAIGWTIGTLFGIGLNGKIGNGNGKGGGYKGGGFGGFGGGGFGGGGSSGKW
ncbi:MAG: TPM domain-containing protein [Candidatus Gracilibacteria bacterium]|nr:TPM domain-containing protein [Candidatus Gracilibacteria bacterium]